MTEREKTHDLVCIGRAAVDLYGEQIGSTLEDVQSFAKSLGGSAANVATGAARQGLRVAMIARVGDEAMGRFVRRELAREGVDVRAVTTDTQRLTALVLLSIRDQETFPLIFYRENCADMALDEGDIDESLIASARALLVTGTHFSRPNVDRASRKAIEFAKKHHTQVVLDIDYRPVLWRLTGHGAGENRFVESDEVTRHIQGILPLCDLVVGTEDEFRIAGGDLDVRRSLTAVRSCTTAALVLKRGAKGAAVFTLPQGRSPHEPVAEHELLASGRAVPAPLPPAGVGASGAWREDGDPMGDHVLLEAGLPVDVLNVLGAGDAFLAGFLRGHLCGEGWSSALRLGNAAGALVVSRHACTPAMPSREELDDYLSRAQEVPRIDKDLRIAHLHRVANRASRRARLPTEASTLRSRVAPLPTSVSISSSRVPASPTSSADVLNLQSGGAEGREDLCVLAFDHRASLERLAEAAGKDGTELPRLKGLILRAAERVAASARVRVGVIIDERFGRDALRLAEGSDVWTARPIERISEPDGRFEFEADELALTLRSWPASTVVKCLIHYHPDHPARALREAQLVHLHEVVVALDRDFLLEIIPMKGSAVDVGAIPRAMERLYEIGIRPDWWKLPPVTVEAWRGIEQTIARNDPHCLGVLLLGLDAPEHEIVRAFADAAPFTACCGFAVGRTIFGEPAERWLRGHLDDEGLVTEVCSRFERLIASWIGARTRE